jgi:hypothetical protein
MTPFTANDAGVICRAQLTGEGRWVSLALSLADLTSANRFLVSAERLLYEMAGADYEAGQYGLLNWQGGISSGDVWAVSAAASLAVARLLGRPEVPLDLGGWQVEEVRRAQPAEDGSESTKVVSSEREPPQARGDSHSPASGRTDPDQASQAIPAEPGAAADGGA